jgi:hypothetical protein
VSRLTLLVSLTSTTPAIGYDLNDKVSIGGILANAGPCSHVSEDWIFGLRLTAAL